MTEALTVTGGDISIGNCIQFYPTGDYYPWWQIPPAYPFAWPSIAWYTPAGQRVCSGDVHVFPCEKCGECQCGKAKLAKRRRR